MCGSSKRGRWIPLALSLTLLLCASIPAAPLSARLAGAQTPSEKNAAAAKRLQRQRQHMEKQRERIKDNRKRFKEQVERQRRRLKNEKAAAKVNGKQASGDDDDDDQAQQDGNDSGVWSGFFPWVTGGDFSDNLLTGLGLAAMGVAGSLILVFTLLGSFLPSMGGKADYEALQLEIAALSKRRDQQLLAREKYVRSEVNLGAEERQEASNVTHDLTEVIQGKEEEARRKYRQVLWLGIPIYVVIGGALAVLLATNALQALLIGFAWTSIVDRLGLKREEKEKEERRGDLSNDLVTEAKQREDEVLAKNTEIKDLKNTLSTFSDAIAKLAKEAEQQGSR
jgi:hypothetical protein